MRKLTPIQVLIWFVGLWLILPEGVALPGFDPPPFKADKLCVLVVEESDVSQSTTPAWVNSTKAGGLQEYIKKRGGEFRLIDQHNPTDIAEPHWKEAMAVKRESLPWIVAAGPRSGTTQALPATAEATIKILEGVK